MSPLAAYIDQDDMFNPERSMEKISLEFMFLDNMVETLRDLLPGLSTQLRTIGDRLVGFVDDSEESNKPSTQSELTKQQRAAVQNMAKLNFLTYGEFSIIIPENFQGNMTDYAKTLSNVLPDTLKTVSELLSEYTAILASFITNKEDKNALKEHEAVYMRLDAKTTENADLIKPYFPKITGVTRAPLVKLFSNFKNVEQCFDFANKVRDVHVIKNMEQINSKVRQALELLDIITKNIHDKKLTQVGANAGKNLAQGAYFTAKAVEQLAGLYFASLVMLKSVDSTTAMIAKA